MQGSQHTVRVTAGLTIVAIAVGLMLSTSLLAQATGDVTISEIRIDQSGTDSDEYFELAAAAGTSLDGLAYLVIGDGRRESGVIEAVIDLSGKIVPDRGYFVAAEVSFTLGAADLITDLNFENSDNVTHLLVRGFSGSNGQDLDTDDDGVLDSMPWTELVDLIAMVEEPNPPTGTEHHYGPPSVGPERAYVPGHAFVCEDGWQSGSFDVGVDDTPGVANACEVCGDPFTPIYEVQGSGATSPYEGTVVSVEGVVTGDFQGSAELNGFYIQDADGDGDPYTSDGIFVYAPGAIDVSMGDHVRVRGEVDEYYEMTEITWVQQVWPCGTGRVYPTFVSLGDLEPCEGMLVTIQEPLVASDHYNVHRYGEVAVSTRSRQFNPTNLVTPGAAAADSDGDGISDVNESSRIMLDDGSATQFPATVPYIAPEGTLRLGDTVTGLTGALGYDFGSYRLHPTAPVVFDRNNFRKDAPADVGGAIKVATFNTFHYWTTIDDGTNDARGADSEIEFERQRAKAVATILGLGADVVGLQELENNGPLAIGDLVAALNAASGLGGVWAAVPDPAYPGGLESTDAVKAGLIYRTDRVMPVGDSVADDDPAFAADRPPVAQTFDASGEVFTVVVNHFKSKSCTEAEGLDLDQGDGQGCYNYRRIAQAEALLGFVESLQALAGDEDVIVVGDLNAYAQEDPIITLERGLRNPMDMYVPVDAQYSYVYFGQAGLLDHLFTTDSLVTRVTGADVWHINADEPRVLDYNDEVIDPAEYYGDFSHDYLYLPDQYRSADHDPLILGFCDAVQPAVEIHLKRDNPWLPEHGYAAVHADVDVVDNFDPVPTLELISVTSNDQVAGATSGGQPDDIVIVNDFVFRLRSHRSGIGDGPIYAVTYRATDSCGNSTEATAEVAVSHN